MGLRVLDWENFVKYATRFARGRADILIDREADVVILRRAVESSSVETAVVHGVPELKRLKELQESWWGTYWFDPVKWFSREDEYRPPKGDSG